jgi:toxin YoeB
MEVAYLEKALKDLKYWQSSGNKIIQNRIVKLINDIQMSPFEGIGKPESLKYSLSGKWSRRITESDRIIYSISKNTLFIYSLRSHYD